MVARRKKPGTTVHSLTIRQIPRPVLDKLRLRAEQNQRSMQGEVLAILEEAAQSPGRRLSPRELLAHGRALGINTPSESVEMIREDRDGR